MQNDQNQTVEQLFNLGAHLGHRKSRVHPKAYKYIHKVMNGVSIIDLTKTVDLLNKAKTVLEKEAKQGKKLLVVATKKNIAHLASEICGGMNVPFTTSKWMPGLLTNFDNLSKNVKKLESMKQEQADGTWEQYVKHERMKMSKELYKLERFYKGLVSLKKLPDLILVIDTKKEKNAVIEAKKFNMPIVAIVDTNSNPEDVNYPIIMNDDSPEVVEHVLKELVQTYADNYQEPKKKTEAEEQQAELEPAVESKAPKKGVKAKKEEAPAKETEVKAETVEKKPAAKSKAKAKTTTKESKTVTQ